MGYVRVAVVFSLLLLLLGYVLNEERFDFYTGLPDGLTPVLCVVGQGMDGFVVACGCSLFQKLVNFPGGDFAALQFAPKELIGVAQGVRSYLNRKGPALFDAVLKVLGRWSMLALLTTLSLLFAFQGDAIVTQPLIIVMLSVPILLQVVFNAGLAYRLNRRLGELHAVACPSALIGASNFFELAVAAAISLFGLHSGAALATVVGA